MRALANADVSLAVSGTLDRAVEEGKPSKGSQTSRENGSKMLLRRPPKMLGTSDILGELINYSRAYELKNSADSSESFDQFLSIMMSKGAKGFVFIREERQSLEFSRIFVN